ncbi:protein of unknown function [Taphrina deformans PYCC 5710]|uniref:Uncharacterized protein n=1 Tax=Taphrina deformans (strain PYCC 5710 / ATCC 11124 / CBS 356.35 / IMI 108563 / JCM 9778 / NBRC 8474) TaxID=1097556 RepID=R4XD04_TAPDE|nr:protein of unknown function [Taphrina deformans PYCC 5710]|eukprot:CCG83756.1 protein of unknown function [Taphrina deformans PYCC 5710]
MNLLETDETIVDTIVSTVQAVKRTNLVTSTAELKGTIVLHGVEKPPINSATDGRVVSDVQTGTCKVAKVTIVDVTTGPSTGQTALSMFPQTLCTPRPASQYETPF